MNSNKIRNQVRKAYSKIALEGGSCCGGSACYGRNNIDSPAIRLGYDPNDLSVLPDGSDLGLSCGNPVAIAELKPGEVVLDLGCGAGFDVFIAARRVGQTGRVIGVDMTPEMIAKARRNAVTFRRRTRLDNVEFRLGEIEHLPMPEASVDVVISNCVINLSPDKPRVWREIARVLKPGGRVAVSDVALVQPLPQAIAESVQALVGCIAGAVLVSETERMAREAGLVDIQLDLRSDWVDSMADWQDPFYREILAHLPPGTKPSDFITSLEITARKPRMNFLDVRQAVQPNFEL